MVCAAGMWWIACDQARMDRRKPGHSWPETREAGLRAPRSYIQPVCILSFRKMVICSFMGSSFPALGGDGRGAMGGRIRGDERTSRRVVYFGRDENELQIVGADKNTAARGAAVWAVVKGEFGSGGLS